MSDVFARGFSGNNGVPVQVSSSGGARTTNGLPEDRPTTRRWLTFEELGEEQKEKKKKKRRVRGEVGEIRYLPALLKPSQIEPARNNNSRAKKQTDQIGLSIDLRALGNQVSSQIGSAQKSNFREGSC